MPGAASRIMRMSGPQQPAAAPWAARIHASGILAQRPAAANALLGYLYLATDTNGGTLYECQLSAGQATWVQVGSAVVDPTYALLAGRSGGQVLKGDTASGGNLTLQSTAHATRGKVLIGTSGAYDETINSLGVGTQSPSDYFGLNVPTVEVHNAGTGTLALSRLMLTTSGTGNGTIVGSLGFATSGASTSGSQVSAAIRSVLTAASGSTATGNLSLYTANAGAMTEQIQIDETGKVTFTSLVKSYNGDTLAGNGAGTIIGSVKNTNLSANVGATTLCTAPTTGVYLVVSSIVCTTAQATGAVVLSVNFQNDGASGQAHSSSSLSFTTAGNDASITTPYIQAVSGTTITYSTTVTGVVTTGRYAVYISIVRVQ